MNKKILIIGGTGSLGKELTQRYLTNTDYNIYLLSRDESKHWALSIEYQYNPRIHFIIGNIADSEKMKQTIIRHNFEIIILAAAMKHIDRCEYESNECINTNLLGTKYVLDEIENNLQLLTNLKSVCFISTDKACSPINIYGMSKAISESLMVEKSKYIDKIKFVCVRYGNVLNSRGSIIPALHKIGQDPNIKEYKLTDSRMTRFVMTLAQSVDLVFHAINHAESGDIVIPKLVSCQIKDLIDIFSEFYQKPVVIDKLRPGEKMLESLINETQSLRLEFGPDGFMYIKPPYKNIMTKNDVNDYNSHINPLDKLQLKKYLEKLNLIPLSKPNLNLKITINQNDYLKIKPFPYYSQSNFLPDDFALKCQQEILELSDDQWDRYSNPFEGKYTLRNKDNLPENSQMLFDYLRSEQFMEQLSNISGQKLIQDSTKNWWGIHKYDDGDHLDIHVDAGIHPETKQKKHLTLGIYLSKDWKEENGGHLEIWNGDKVIEKNCQLHSCSDKILPVFNTLVIFNCTDNAWHGNPIPVKIKNNEKRIFLTISYLSEIQEDNYQNQLQKAYFIKRPNDPKDHEKDKLRLLRCDPDKYKEIYNLN